MKAIIPWLFIQTFYVQCFLLHHSNINQRDYSLLRSESSFSYEGRIDTPHENFRCGFVTLIGEPNMGKSTLMNQLVGESLCATTPRPQTTRHAILGILEAEDCQVCIRDTPGILKETAYALQDCMMDAVTSAVRTTDVTILVTDPFADPTEILELVPSQIQFKPLVIAVNKMDLVQNEKNATMILQQWQEATNALAVLPLAAKHSRGVDFLIKILTGVGGVAGLSRERCMTLLPESPPLYPQDSITDRTERFLASEMIRAVLFLTLKQELPYCCQVTVSKFKREKKLIVEATIYVERQSQKKMVIGKGGSQIKEIGMAARKDLKDFFETPISLFLQVSVQANWRRQSKDLQEFGY